MNGIEKNLKGRLLFSLLLSSFQDMGTNSLINLIKKVVSVLENYHMITYQNMFNNYNGCLIESNTASFVQFELENIGHSDLLIESCLSEELWAMIQVRFGSLKELNKSVLFLMALKSCRASVAQDMQGAYPALVSLSLTSYHRDFLLMA